MQFDAPPLPYSRKALAPTISEEALKEHYEKHFKGYLKQLNAIDQVKSAEEETPLEKFILMGAKKSWKAVPKGTIPPLPEAGHLFNMASQVYNHVFFWNSLKKGGGGEPNGEIESGVTQYGGLERLRSDVVKAGMSIFGSGWVWLCILNGRLTVLKASDAAPPIIYDGYIPLLTIDVWEHAYYLDYKSNREKFIGEVFDNLLNWDFANDNLENA